MKIIISVGIVVVLIVGFLIASKPVKPVSVSSTASSTAVAASSTIK